MGFERKIKYLVIKEDDIEQALTPMDHLILSTVLNKIERHREARGASPTIEAVVIRKEMDCYEAAWKLVEDEVNGKVKV